MCAVILAAFLWLPPAGGFAAPDAARMIVFHVPNAMVAVLAFLVSAVYAIQYLRTRDRGYDIKSSASAELGLLFSILATVTGALFAKVQWGSAWNWDSREVTMLILLMIYAAYFALRSSVEGADRRATLSSAYAIIAFVTVPFLVFVLPRMVESLHPSNTLTSKEGLGTQYRIVLFSAMSGFVGLYLWLFRLAVSVAEMRNVKKGTE